MNAGLDELYCKACANAPDGWLRAPRSRSTKPPAWCFPIEPLETTRC